MLCCYLIWGVIFGCLIFRMGIVFSHLAMPQLREASTDNPIIAVIRVFWPMLEKLFGSEHMENSSLAAAACRALSLAIQSSGIGQTFHLFSFLFVKSIKFGFTFFLLFFFFAWSLLIAWCYNSGSCLLCRPSLWNATAKNIRLPVNKLFVIPKSRMLH